MKIARILWTFTTVLSALTAGCATSHIVLFQKSATGQQLTPVRAPDQVEVYRTANPFPKFTELGLITFHTSVFNLPLIYTQLRKDSSAAGADAVVAVKVTGESHQEAHEVSHTVQDCMPDMSCDINGMCQSHQNCTDRTVWETVWETVTSYMVEGSMIRVADNVNPSTGVKAK